MRAFLAIEISDTVRAGIARLSRDLRQAPVRASWVRPENLHVTLRFLGDVGANDVARLADRLHSAYAPCAPFELSARGVGAFPNLRRPSVLWVGVQQTDSALAHVQSLAEEAAEHIGLDPDRKRFHGHITLARLREPNRAEALIPLVEKVVEFDGGEFAVRYVTLFESQLGRGGAQYTPLRTFPLAGSGI